MGRMLIDFRYDDMRHVRGGCSACLVRLKSRRFLCRLGEVTRPSSMDKVGNGVSGTGLISLIMVRFAE